MIEYEVFSTASADTLTSKINRLASKGWVVSEFSVSNAGTYGDHRLYAVVMEREKP